MEITTFTITIIYFVLIVIIIAVVIDASIKQKEAIPYKFIKSYKDYTIFKDLRDGYYFALNKDEKMLNKRLTIEFLERDIDVIDTKDLNTTKRL